MIIDLETAQSTLFHPFDPLTTLQSSLSVDPCPEYDMYAVNQLSTFCPPVLTETGLDWADEKVQELLTLPCEVYPFIENELHLKFTSLYAMERYLEGKLPGTMDSFGPPYVSSGSTVSLGAFGKGNVPFYLTPRFFLQHVTPAFYDEERDVSMRPHFAELMHFRDRFPYVESSFLYVQNLLCRKAHYLFAYRYYGSFQGVQQLFKYFLDKEELRDFSLSSVYFRQKMRKLFFMYAPDLLELEKDLRDDDDDNEKERTLAKRFPLSRATDKLKMYPLYVKQLPVHIQLMEKLTGMNMYAFLLRVCLGKLPLAESELMSLMAQVALQLEMYDRLFKFRHNDLHGQNVMICQQQQGGGGGEAITFEFEDTASISIPIFEGRIARVIDFGRAKFELKGEQFFSDEMAPWGAVNDHCNAKSSAYFKKSMHRRPVSKPVDFAYLCCMLTQYIYFTGGSKGYKHFLETYPVVFELMYECTKQVNGISFLESGMEYIRAVVNSADISGAKRKRRRSNYRLIEPKSVSFDADLLLDIIDQISPTIEPLRLFSDHPRISAFFSPFGSSSGIGSGSVLAYRERELRELVEQHFQAPSEEARRERSAVRETHRTGQSQLLHQIRREYRGKTQNPFRGLNNYEERDADDFEDSF